MMRYWILKSCNCSKINGQVDRERCVFVKLVIGLTIPIILDKKGTFILKEKALFGPANSFFKTRLKVVFHDPCAKFHELISKRCFYDQGVKWVLVVVIAAEMRAALIRAVRPYALLCYTQPGLEALRGHSDEERRFMYRID